MPTEIAVRSIRSSSISAIVEMLAVQAGASLRFDVPSVRDTLGGLRTFLRFMAVAVLGGVCGYCQAADNDPAAILEVGGAVGRSLTDHSSSYGGSVAVEVTPIENWLEIEAGVTSLFARHSAEWDVDFLFKKPWTLSKKVEFMVGIGPEWVHTREGGVVRNALAGEGVLDFMFWPSEKRRFGWYVEPAYDYAFGHGHERSMGVTAGLLIAVGR